MGIPQKYGPLAIPSYKTDWNPYSWTGRPLLVSQSQDLPVLWNPANLKLCNADTTLLYFLGAKGAIAAGRPIRFPRVLLGASNALCAELVSRYRAGIDRTGLFLASGRITVPGTSSLTGFLPFRLGAAILPAHYVGGEIYFIGPLTVNKHFTVQTSNYTPPSVTINRYHLVTHDAENNPITPYWEFTTSYPSTPDPITYRTGAVSLPAYEADIPIAGNGLARFRRARMVIGGPPLAPREYTEVYTSSDRFDQVGAGQDPPPLGPDEEDLAIDSVAYGGSNYYHRSVGHLHTAPISEAGYVTAISGLCQGAAARIGHGCVVKNYNSDVELVPDVVAFFGLDAPP